MPTSAILISVYVIGGKTNAQPSTLRPHGQEGQRVWHEIGTADKTEFNSIGTKRDGCTAVLQPSIQSEPKRGDIVREVDVKEGAGRRKQGIQDKDMFATHRDPYQIALRSIQSTDM